MRRSFGNTNLVTGGLMTRVGVGGSSFPIWNRWGAMTPYTRCWGECFGLFATWEGVVFWRSLGMVQTPKRLQAVKVLGVRSIEEMATKKGVVTIPLNTSIPLPLIVNPTSGVSEWLGQKKKDSSSSAKESWMGFRYCVPSETLFRWLRSEG